MSKDFDKDKVELCEKYIYSNLDMFRNKLNDAFNNSKELLKLEVIKLVQNIFKNYKPIHYKWYIDDSGYIYDWSGDIRKVGDINTNKTTLIQFLEDEYTGNWIATYESGHGRLWETWDDYLINDTLAIGYTIYRKTICDLLPVELTDNEFEYIYETVADRELYFESPYCHCFSPSMLLSYIDDEEFNNILLHDILNIKID